jgi:hypothetical protein
MGAGIDVARLHLRWFDQWLKGRDTGILDTRRPLRVIEPGGERYRTRAYPAERREHLRLRLGAGGALAEERAANGSTSVTNTLLNDPCNRGVSQQWSAGMISAGLTVLLGRDPCATEPPASDLIPGEAQFTSAPLARDLRLAGPAGLRLVATSTRPESIFVARLFDVAPDASATELTGGALLGSLRALDRRRSWRAPGGGFVLPYHRLTADSQQPVPAGESVRYEIEVRPVFTTIPAGHRLRLRIATGDFPHLAPPPTALPSLIGGEYRIAHGASLLDLVTLPAGG